jgi:hypothetical protein
MKRQQLAACLAWLLDLVMLALAFAWMVPVIARFRTRGGGDFAARLRSGAGPHSPFHPTLSVSTHEHE